MEADKVLATHSVSLEKAQILADEQLKRANEIVSRHLNQIDTAMHNQLVIGVLQAMATNFAALQGR